MTIDILHLVDRLETLLSKSWRLPFTSNVVVQEDAFLDIIDQMRISIPEEVKQAKRITAERERLLQQAQEEADRIVALAQEQVGSLADNHEIVKTAQAHADEVLERAQHSAETVKGDADTYVMETLSSLEEQLLMLLTTVRNGIRQVQGPASHQDADHQAPKGDGGG